MTGQLEWPAGRRRATYREDAKFRDRGGAVGFDVAVKRLEQEIDKLGAKNVRLTMNVARSLSGKAIGSVNPADPGVALYFDLGGKPFVLACDKWRRLPDNIAALAAHIEALRGQDRWGVSEGVEQAFAGHAALPAPKTCWQVLGIPEGSDPTVVNQAFRRLADLAHPDKGGSHAAMAEINRARTEALAAKGAVQ